MPQAHCFVSPRFVEIEIDTYPRPLFLPFSWLYVSRDALTLVGSLAPMLMKRSDVCKPPRLRVWGCFRTVRAPRGFLTSRWRCRQSRYLIRKYAPIFVTHQPRCSLLQRTLALSTPLCTPTAADNVGIGVFLCVIFRKFASPPRLLPRK